MRHRNARSRGAANALVTPGTTSNGTPACPSASASSPPRPNTKGSPPFSRTTRRPRRAARIITAWISAWRQRVPARALADEEALRPPGDLQDALVDERVVEHQVRGRSRATAVRVRRAGIARTGADQRDMIRWCSQGASQNRTLPRRRVGRRKSFSASSSNGRRASIGTPIAPPGRLATLRASSIQRPRSRGSIASSASRKQRRQPRRVAARRDRDRHAVAAHDAAQERAGVRRIVDGIDKDPARSAASATCRLTSGVAAATTSQAPSRSVGANSRRDDRDTGPLDVGMHLG